MLNRFTKVERKELQKLNAEKLVDAQASGATKAKERWSFKK
jgi:hypothetical protein